MGEVFCFDGVFIYIKKIGKNHIHIKIGKDKR